MRLNLIGKIKYITHVIRNYPEWYLIFASRIAAEPLQKLQLGNGLKIVGGKKSLIFDIVDEIFVQKVYNPEFMHLTAVDTVIDIGANIGIYSLYAASAGAKNIYCFEPLPSNIILINKNFEINKLKKPIIVEAAVSDKNGYEKLFLGETDPHGSLFNYDRKKTRSKYIRVKSVTLEKIIGDYNIKNIDFLKIDCEGGEGKIIVSTPTKVFKKIRKIAIEYHDRISTISHQEIAKRLKSQGFKVKVRRVDDYLGYIYAWR